MIVLWILLALLIVLFLLLLRFCGSGCRCCRGNGGFLHFLTERFDFLDLVRDPLSGLIICIRYSLSDVGCGSACCSDGSECGGDGYGCEYGCDDSGFEISVFHFGVSFQSIYFLCCSLSD